MQLKINYKKATTAAQFNHNFSCCKQLTNKTLTQTHYPVHAQSIIKHLNSHAKQIQTKRNELLNKRQQQQVSCCCCRRSLYNKIIAHV